VLAAEQSHWIGTVVLPALAVLTPQYLAEYVESYIDGLEKISQNDRSELLQRVMDTVNEPRTSDHLKRRAIVQILMKMGARAMVKKLVRTCKKGRMPAFQEVRRSNTSGN
jgi:hypothetical protein